MYKGFGPVIYRLPRTGHFSGYRAHIQNFAFIPLYHVSQKAFGKDDIGTNIQLYNVEFSLNVIMDKFTIDALSRIIDQDVDGNTSRLYLIIDFKSSIVATE